MPGLNLGVGANVRASAQAPVGSSNARATTATAAAFGSDLSPAAGVTSLLPNDAGGMAFWIGVSGLAWLVVLYLSLPA